MPINQPLELEYQWMGRLAILVIAFKGTWVLVVVDQDGLQLAVSGSG